VSLVKTVTQIQETQMLALKLFERMIIYQLSLRWLFKIACVVRKKRASFFTLTLETVHKLHEIWHVVLATTLPYQNAE